MEKITIFVTLLISALLMAAGVIIQMNKCGEPNNRKYAKTVTGATVGLVGAAAIFQFKTQIFTMLTSLVKENKTLVIPIVMSVLMVASTSVIIDNKCTDKENKKYGIASIITGTITALASVYFLTKKNENNNNK